MKFGAITNSWRNLLDDQDLSSLVEAAKSKGAKHIELRQTCLGDCETGEGEEWRPVMSGLQALVDKFPDLSFDLAMALPFLTQLWMYLSPIVYPASLVPARYQWLLALNPIAGITELNRYAFLGQGTVVPEILMFNVVVTGVVFVSGLLIFNRVQRTFIDFV